MSQNVIAVLEERGFVSQMTETGLREAAETGQLVAYCGFDPTAPSLHIGHVVQVMILAHLQRAGHQAIGLVGGGTGLIGDPSGRSEERPLLDKEAAARNVERIREQLGRFLRFDGPNPAVMVDNLEWLGAWRLVDFLRDIGKHFTINSMLAKDSVRIRLDERDQGLSYTEFSYMLLQSADFLHLHRTLGCNMQVGGSDQWGNITAGADLIRRAAGGQAHGLTSPLLTTSSGAKFGKSAGNAIWVDAELTSPYQLFQYWVNTDDRDVGRFLKIFTFLSLNEIAELERGVQEAPERREAQRRLAHEFVTLVHGPELAASAQAASDILFGRAKGALAETLRGSVIDLLEREIATYHVASAALDEGVGVIDALVGAGLAASRGEARRLIAQKGASLNGEPIADEAASITSASLLDGRAALLSKGKRSHGLLLATL